MGGENGNEQGESGEIGFDVSDDLAQKRIGGLEGVMIILVGTEHLMGASHAGSSSSASCTMCVAGLYSTASGESTLHSFCI